MIRINRRSHLVLSVIPLKLSDDKPGFMGCLSVYLDTGISVIPIITTLRRCSLLHCDALS